MANTVRLADSGSTLGALSSAELQGLGAAGIDTLDATDNAISLTGAQVHALVNQTSGSVGLAATDSITVADTGAALGALSVADLTALAAEGAGSVVLDASDNAFALNLAQYSAIIAGGIGLAGSDFVTLTDTGSALATFLTVQNISAAHSAGIDAINATDNGIEFSIAQLNALSGAHVALTGGNTVTLLDARASIEALTAAQLAAYVAQGVDDFTAAGNKLHLTELQVAAVLGTSATFAGTGSVSLIDSGTNIAELTAVQFGQLAAHGVGHIDATNNVLTLTIAQYSGLGTTTLTSSNDVTLYDTGANLGALTSVQLAHLAAKGIDTIDATDNVLSLTIAQYNALGSVSLTQADAVTLSDTGARLSALTALQLAQLAGHGIDSIDASNGTLTLSLSQFNALGTVTLASGDFVTLRDTGANLAALSASAIGQLAGEGIDKLDASNNAIDFSLAQYNALGGVALTANDVITINGTSGNDVIVGPNNNAVLIGGAGNDIITPGAGIDTVSAGSGNDTIYMRGNLTAADHIDGGAGKDTVSLSGDYSGGLILAAATITNVEVLYLAAGHSYNLTTNDATVAAGQTLTVLASAFGAGDSLTFNGSAETDGAFIVRGGAGNDTLTGGAGNDVLSGGNGANFITGGGGADTLTGGSGVDTFVYNGVSDSTGQQHDTLTNFQFGIDRFDLPGAVTGIDATVATGFLSGASFDANLALAIGASISPRTMPSCSRRHPARMRGTIPGGGRQRHRRLPGGTGFCL